MKTIKETDSQTVLDALISGKPLDPEVIKRVQERSKTIREELKERFGTRDIAVDLIRECRDE